MNNKLAKCQLRKDNNRMNYQKIMTWVTDLISNSPENVVQASYAIQQKDIGMKLFSNPIFAFGDANDSLFEVMRDPKVIGPQYLIPTDWVTDAKTVILLQK